jgi:hypothetical protein
MRVYGSGGEELQGRFFVVGWVHGPNSFVRRIAYLKFTRYIAPRTKNMNSTYIQTTHDIRITSLKFLRDRNNTIRGFSVPHHQILQLIGELTP